MPLAGTTTGLPLVRRANIAVAEAIREGIIGGELAPGEEIIEEDVARALGVSRTPVREALLLLAGEQLVRLAAGRGERATVRTMDRDELQQMFELRGLLEGYAARRAATRISEAELVSLEDACARMEEIGAGNVRDLLRENVEFHSTILRAAKSDRLTFIVSSLLQVPYSYKEHFWEDEACVAADIGGHLDVIAALRAGNEDAAATAMSRHLRDVGAMSLEKVADSGSVNPV